MSFLARSVVRFSYRSLIKNKIPTETLRVSSFRRLSSTVNQESANQDKEDIKMDNIKSNPYFAKYEAKLKAVYKENPAAFFHSINKSPEKAGKKSDVKNSKMAQSLTKKRTLDSLMKTNMIEDHPVEDIKNIWVTYLEDRGRLADVLQLNEHDKITKRSAEYSTFLYALPREQGYEFILAQWSNNECHFTPLINYQAHGENAPSVMTVIYFDELQESKKIILEMAEFDNKSLKIEEAKFLVHQLKAYYLKSNESDEKFQLLNCFSKSPDQFKHMDLIKQIENDKIKVDDFKTAPKAETTPQENIEANKKD